jgi:hypothetical protein
MNASVPPGHCHFLCCIEARCKTAINAGPKYNVYLALQAQIAASAKGTFNKANGLAFSSVCCLARRWQGDAAKKLGISRRTLHRKINEMNLAKTAREAGKAGRMPNS